MSQYLQPESFYNDRYDLETIRVCLNYIESSKAKLNDEKIKDLPHEEKLRGLNLFLFLAQGERYEKKAPAIKEWMESDRKLDEKIKNTPEPKNINCPSCRKGMRVISKDLCEVKGSSRVLFLYECRSCEKRKGVYEDGEEYVSKPERCPKCHEEIKVSSSTEGEVMKWTKQCPSCDFSEVEVDDFEKYKTERELREKEEQGLLEKYRNRFCLSDKEGYEYIESMRNIKSLSDLIKKEDQKQTDPDYQTVNKLNKWKIVELEKNLSTALEKEKYQKLMFDKPEIDMYVIVSFTLQDADISRKEGDSQRKLQRLIKKALVGSNWRLMSEGVAYRLGYLSGRLKGYEREGDLLQLIKQEKL